MNHLKNNILLLSFSIIMFSCKKKDTINSPSNSETTIKQSIELAGNYVSSEYERRQDGFDWISVSVTKYTDSTIHIKVRSRADKKKPACTFDADAIKINDTVYKSNVEGKNILYVFNKESLSIKTANNEESDILYYFCSGGGTLADTYHKINDELDQTQIDQRVFQKTLFLQNIGFDISTKGGGSIQQLTIQPFGLKLDNAEIEDLNSDGFPEVLIYTVSAGSGSYGNVIGYSVNNGKSISQIYFPPISDNSEASKGYMGHDEFTIVETNLVQRFRIYKEDDSNSNPTGDWRQIQYKLVNGEASRKFVIDKIDEYPSK